MLLKEEKMDKFIGKARKKRYIYVNVNDNLEEVHHRTDGTD
jgi:hypothetical protein